MLLIDDDLRLADVLTVALGRAGLELEHAATAGAAMGVSNYDAVLLDLNLPDSDGLDLCRRIRESSSVPIIIVSASGDLADKVTGLRRGADDYLVKPFSVAELLARLEAVLRRGRPAALATRTMGGLSIDLDRQTVAVGGAEIPLTRKEFHLLSILADPPGAVIRKEQLVGQVWRTSGPSAHRTVEVHISSLRTKMKDAARIETVRGVGYRLVPLVALTTGPET
jgi:DNA-binding response OmpR family regulator